MSQLAESLEAAVRVLVGDGPVKQRLRRAYTEHLADLEHAELPQKLGEPFVRLQGAMHRVAPMGTTSCPVKASVQKMSAREAGRHAVAILELYEELLRMRQRAEPLKVVDSAGAPKAATSS